MPSFLVTFVRVVESVNYFIGRIAMHLLFVLCGVLLWSILAKAFFRPPLWTQEMAQFVMVGYFVLGGAYSLQLGSNVRMDLLYSRWRVRRRAAVNVFTTLTMIVFLGVILWGGIESTLYAFEIGERSRSVWRPYLAPIKIVICFGVFLMILQSLAYVIRDIAVLRQDAIPDNIATLRFRLRPYPHFVRSSINLPQT